MPVLGCSGGAWQGYGDIAPRTRAPCCHRRGVTVPPRGRFTPSSCERAVQKPSVIYINTDPS